MANSSISILFNLKYNCAFPFTVILFRSQKKHASAIVINRMVRLDWHNGEKENESTVDISICICDSRSSQQRKWYYPPVCKHSLWISNLMNSDDVLPTWITLVLTGFGAPFLPKLPHPHLHCPLFCLYTQIFFQDERHFFFLTLWRQGHCPPCSTTLIPSTLSSLRIFLPLTKSFVHCPPDSHPSTWVQFKKPFNSCHSTGLAISPAAKAQTGTLLQQATLNVRLVLPIPNRLKVKDSIS